MKVLIITYYWPPAGGSGVQRWLFFVKYLHYFGVEPVVFTIANPNYPIKDNSLHLQVPDNVEVIKQKIWEPHLFLSGKNKEAGAGLLQAKPSFIQKIIYYIRANYFIPDARKFWIKPSVRTLTKYLQKKKVNWIITTGPPHSVHLIGLRLKEQIHGKWLADFRDPWTEIDYFHHLPLSKGNRKKHLELERSVLSNADIVTVVSNSMREKFKVYNSNCYTITNGYDSDNATAQKIPLDSHFSLTHIGMLNADRNPLLFWKVIRNIIDENPDFEKRVGIHLIGKIGEEVKQSIQKYDLQKYVQFLGYLLHNEAVRFQMKSQVLLLFINNVPYAKGIVTGKIFEYLKAGRPILAVAPTKGDLDEIISSTHSGKVVDFNDEVGLKKHLLTYYDQFLEGKLYSNTKNIERYHRKNLTARLVKLLKKN